MGILLTQSIGALSGWLSRDGMQIFSTSISQPPLSPPAFLFPIVWGVLYALMGIGAVRIYLSPQSTERSMALNVYITQLIVNFFWSLIFFNAQAYLFAFFWLLILLFLVLWIFPLSSSHSGVSLMHILSFLAHGLRIHNQTAVEYSPPRRAAPLFFLPEANHFPAGSQESD